MLWLLWVVTAPADVIMSATPETCPTGAIPRMQGHGGYRCELHVCSTDADCQSSKLTVFGDVQYPEGSTVACVETSVCSYASSYVTNPQGRVYNPDYVAKMADYVAGAGLCADDGSCETGNCSAKKVCIWTTPPATPPSEEPPTSIGEEAEPPAGSVPVTQPSARCATSAWGGLASGSLLLVWAAFRQRRRDT